MTKSREPRVIGRITLPEDTRKKQAEQAERGKLAKIAELLGELINRRFSGEVKLTMYRGSLSKKVVAMEHHPYTIDVGGNGTGQVAPGADTIATERSAEPS